MNSSVIVDWASIKVDDIIKLKDRQTIEELLAAKVPNALSGLNLTVKKVRRIKADAVTWNVFDTDKYLIVAKICDNEISTRVYFAVDNFTPGNRKDLIESGQTWLFIEPHGKDWSYNDLEYIPVLTNNFDGKNVNFNRKGDSYYGKTGRQFTQVTEWYGEHVNPHVLAIETGDSPDGGYIEFYMGCDLAEHDYEILNQ